MVEMYGTIKTRPLMMETQFLLNQQKLCNLEVAPDLGTVGVVYIWRTVHLQEKTNGHYI